MKRTTIVAALLAAALAAQPSLSGAQTPADKPAAKPRAGMQMDPKTQQQMMDCVKDMQAQMDKMRQTTEPKEREKLLADHTKSMQEGMQMMHAMGGGMTGGGQGGSSGQSAETMERRMDMMQMEQMQHQQMMQQAPGK